jgi:hypothetical protein
LLPETYYLKTENKKKTFKFNRKANKKSNFKFLAKTTISKITFLFRQRTRITTFPCSFAKAINKTLWAMVNTA